MLKSERAGGPVTWAKGFHFCLPQWQIYYHSFWHGFTGLGIFSGVCHGCEAFQDVYSARCLVKCALRAANGQRAAQRLSWHGACGIQLVTWCKFKNIWGCWSLRRLALLVILLESADSTQK